MKESQPAEKQGNVQIQNSVAGWKEDNSASILHTKTNSYSKQE